MLDAGSDHDDASGAMEDAPQTLAHAGNQREPGIRILECEAGDDEREEKASSVKCCQRCPRFMRVTVRG